MITNLVYTELMKYKRTIIPLVIVSGSFLATLMGVFMSTDNGNMTWTALIAYGLGWLNLLALLLIAVFTGIVFAGEYTENTSRILFTYPVARWKFYIVKYIIILFWVICYYLAFSLFTLISGCMYMGDIPHIEVLSKFFQLILLMSTANFVLVPVTALVSILFEGTISFILAGTSYIAMYFSFIRSDYKYYIPMVIPNVIKDKYLVSELLSSADWGKIMMAWVFTFLITFFVGMFCYTKKDV